MVVIPCLLTALTHDPINNNGGSVHHLIKQLWIFELRRHWDQRIGVLKVQSVDLDARHGIEGSVLVCDL